MIKVRWDLVIGILILINVSEIFAVYVLGQRSNIYNVFTTFPVTVGYRADKTFVTDRIRPKCTLIRFYSNTCPHCVKDNPKYIRLSRRASSIGCETIALTPAPEADKLLSGDADITQIQYINMEFSRVVMPFSTPETVLVNSHGKVAWNRIGEIDKASLAAANMTLSNLD